MKIKLIIAGSLFVLMAIFSALMTRPYAQFIAHRLLNGTAIEEIQADLAEMRQR